MLAKLKLRPGALDFIVVCVVVTLLAVLTNTCEKSRLLPEHAQHQICRTPRAPAANGPQAGDGSSQEQRPHIPADGTPLQRA